MNPNEIGKRVICEGFVGTIRYIGTVPPNQGDWLGIEWDDESRGKHAGTHEGVKYFTCRHPTAGSFIRPKKVNYGVTVAQAVRERYGGELGAGDQDTVEIYVAKKQQRDFVSLEEVNLCGMGVGNCGQLGEITGMIPNVTALDLSKNLISSWSAVACIVSQLPQLRSLNLSGNSIQSFQSDDECQEFSQVKVLFLNGMQLSWQEVAAILKVFPLAEEVHLCWNAITTIRINQESMSSRLHLLNLEQNSIEDWSEVMKLACLPCLQTLILNGNSLSSLDLPGDTSFPLLRSLSLSSNKVSEWDSVNNLRALKSLKELRFRHNPLDASEREENARMQLIARLPNLQSLNGSSVLIKEREQAERFYMKQFAQDRQRATNVDEFNRCHPQYDTLVKVHGEPIVSQAGAPTGALKDSLISLTLECPEDPAKKKITKKLPSSMTILKLKALIYRLYKVAASEQRLSYLDQKGREYEMTQGLSTLSFYSVQSGDTVLVRW